MTCSPQCFFQQQMGLRSSLLPRHRGHLPRTGDLTQLGGGEHASRRKLTPCKLRAQDCLCSPEADGCGSGVVEDQGVGQLDPLQFVGEAVPELHSLRAGRLQPSPPVSPEPGGRKRVHPSFHQWLLQPTHSLNWSSSISASQTGSCAPTAVPVTSPATWSTMDCTSDMGNNICFVSCCVCVTLAPGTFLCSVLEKRWFRCLESPLRLLRADSGGPGCNAPLRKRTATRAWAAGAGFSAEACSHRNRQSNSRAGCSQCWVPPSCRIAEMLEHFKSRSSADCPCSPRSGSRRLAQSCQTSRQRQVLRLALTHTCLHNTVN